MRDCEIVKGIRPHLVIHRLALLSLLVVAAMSIVGSMDDLPGAPVERRLAPVLGLALWSWLLWKIWKRPHQWGLGVGIFLFLVIALQSYLWWLAVHNPNLATLDVDRSLSHFILFSELPIFIAGVSCTLLRFSYPS